MITAKEARARTNETIAAMARQQREAEEAEKLRRQKALTDSANSWLREIEDQIYRQIGVGFAFVRVDINDHPQNREVFHVVGETLRALGYNVDCYETSGEDDDGDSYRDYNMRLTW